MRHGCRRLIAVDIPVDGEALVQNKIIRTSIRSSRGRHSTSNPSSPKNKLEVAASSDQGARAFYCSVVRHGFWFFAMFRQLAPLRNYVELVVLNVMVC